MNNLTPSIIHRILEFVDYQDWCQVKPFLISQHFHRVFVSEEYAKFFLIHYLKLSPKEFDHLINFGFKYSHFIDEYRERNNIHIIDYIDEVPKTLNQIMVKYVRLSFQYGIQIAKRRISSNTKISYPERGTSQASDLINNSKYLLTRVRVDNMIVREFNDYLRFGSEFLTENFNITKENPEIIIDGGLTQVMGSNIKDLFLIAGDTLNQNGKTPNYVRCVVFTPCGYPLVLIAHQNLDYESYRETIYSYRVHISEITSNILFNCHYKHYEMLESILFINSFNNEITSDIETLHQLRRLLVYGFVKSAFIVKKWHFNKTIGWTPFCNKEIFQVIHPPIEDIHEEYESDIEERGYEEEEDGEVED